MRTSLTHLVTDNNGKEQDNIVLLLKQNQMARIKQSQNIDDLILSINVIIENRCSLSEEDVTILNEALALLQNLKRKKGKTNKEILETVVEVVVLLSRFFGKESGN